MGCGSSFPKKTKIERFDQSHFKSSIKKPKDEVKYSIEDARKRRQENAKERTRRASVMGLLEAEKLKQRKLSIVSINPIADTTAEEDTDDSLDEVDPRTEMTRSQNQMPVDHKDSNMKKPIQIVISSGSPSNSSLKLTASKDFENTKESNKRKNLIDDASKDSPANQFSEQSTREIRAKEVVSRVIKDAMNSKFDNVETDCRSL